LSVFCAKNLSCGWVKNEGVDNFGDAQKLFAICFDGQGTIYKP
jgi:hypothetical protein